MLDAHAHVMQVKLCKANARGVTHLDLDPFHDEVCQHLGLDRCSGGIHNALIHHLECPFCGSSHGILALDDLIEGERHHDRHRV